MTEADRLLLSELEDFDSLEVAKGSSRSAGIDASLNNIVGNPSFKAQFNLNFSAKYYRNVTPSTLTEVIPSALPANLQNKLPYIVFGQSDFQGGYDKSKNNLSLTGNWSYSNSQIGIVGRDNFQTVVSGDGTNVLTSNFIQAISTGRASNGDMLIVVPQQVPTSSTDMIWAEIVISCPQVAYGTLLDSLTSDIFILNMIRYVVDPLQTDQFNNQIIIQKQTLFGRAGDDKVDPQTYITGMTFNRNIADIPLTLPVDKNKALLVYGNYDVQDWTWTLTVATTKRLR